MEFSLASWRLRPSPCPNPGRLRGSSGALPVLLLWSQRVWPGIKSFCARGSCATSSPWTKSTWHSPGNLQQNKKIHPRCETFSFSGDMAILLCVDSAQDAQFSQRQWIYIEVYNKLHMWKVSFRNCIQPMDDLQWECCRPGREPSASLLSVCRCRCKLCRGPVCSYSWDLFSPLWVCSGWQITFHLLSAGGKKQTFLGQQKGSPHVDRVSRTASAIGWLFLFYKV